MQIKNIRIIILAVLIILSIFLIIYPMTRTVNGAIVVSVDKNSQCGSILENDVISEVNGNVVKNSDDFQKITQSIKAGDSVTLVVNNGPGRCTALSDGYLGINVGDMKSNRLKFGVDIEGGETTTLSPENDVSSQDIERIREIIEDRIGILNLPYSQVSVSDNSIKVSTLSGENLRPLTMIGKFEGGILEYIGLRNNTGSILLGDKQYSFSVSNSSITIENSNYQINQTFALDDVQFNLINITNDSVAIKATAFTNEDIVNVLTRYIFVRYESNLQSYEFNIPVELTDEAVYRYENITKQLTLGRTQPAYENFMTYEIDGNELSIFPLESFGKTINNGVTYVVGLRKSMDAAASDELKAQIALQTDELPTSLEITNIEQFGPTYGNLVIYAFIAVITAVAIASFLLVFYKFRSLKFGLYIIILAVSPLPIIFGEIAVVQTYFIHGWIIDTPTLVGFIAITCMNIAQMYLIAEKFIKNKDISLGFGYKKFIGLSNFIYLLTIITGLVAVFLFRGAGLTIISGVVIGFLITTPIYQQMLKKKSI